MSVTEKDLKKATAIMESWRFVNLSRTALVISGNTHPGMTVQKLREARDDVAKLYEVIVALTELTIRQESELAGLRHR